MSAQDPTPDALRTQMSAQVLKGFRTPLVHEVRSAPIPGPEDVLISVRACGVCGSDVHVADGDLGTFANVPVVLGHEIAGVVVERGASVTGLNVGDRVGIGWTQGTCGQCRYCVQGESALCSEQRVTGVQIDGGYAEYVRVSARDVLRIPDALSFEEAAPLFCAGVTTYTPFRLAGFRPGKRVVVLGLGGLGHLAIQFSHVLGGETIAVTRGQEKAELAISLFGADESIDSTAQDWAKVVREMGGADLILATANSSDLMTQGFHALAADGTLVLLAVDGQPLTFGSSGEFIVNRRRVMGSSTGSIRDMAEMFAVAAKHRVKPMVETYNLTQANEVLQRVREGKPLFRAVLSLQ